MPRIRTIKPEFWIDEKLALLVPLDRLVFLGLICVADDFGRLVDNVKTIDGMLFPYTDDTCRESLDVLASVSRITRYSLPSGMKLIQINGWSKHQRVDKPSRSLLPGPDSEGSVVLAYEKDSRDTRETFATPSRDSREPTMDHGSTIMDHGSTTMDQQHVASVSSNEQGGRRRVREERPREYHHEAEPLANLLADLIEGNGSKRPNVTATWIQEIDRMIRLDGRAPADIAGAIHWSQRSTFWRANILSPKKLRDKFDTLRLQAERENASKTGVSDAVIKGFLERGEQGDAGGLGSLFADLEGQLRD